MSATRRLTWLGSALIAAMLALAQASAAAAAVPRDGYWSKDGLVEAEFPAIVYFFVRGGGTRIEQLSGYFGTPNVIPGACGSQLKDEPPVPVAPDGSFAYDNGEVQLQGRFATPDRAEGTYSFTDHCDGRRRGPFPFHVLLKDPELEAHYRVELKAWVPHHDIVDPLRPLAIPYLAFRASPERGCTDPPVRHWLDAEVSSRYRGNDHLDYPGSAKAHTWVEFDWDGRRITNLMHGEQYDTTHRALLYEWDKGLFGRTSRWCDVQTTTQTEATTGAQLSDDAFALGISSKNPLTPQALTPPISSDLTGRLLPGGIFLLTYDTDLFPSHGFTVIRNGRVQLTNITTDASCLPKSRVIGRTGVETLAVGLTQKVQEGAVVVGPSDVDRRLVAESKLCKLTIDIHRILGLPRARAGTAAARSVAVAPLRAKRRRGRFLALAAAERAGLVQPVRHGDGLLLLSDPRTPVSVRLRGRALSVEMRRVRGGQVRARAAFGPVSGTLVTRLDSRLSGRANGRRLARRRPDRAPPRTRAFIRIRGARARVRFRARDRSGVRRTYVVIGRRLAQLRRGALMIPVRRLKRVRFASVDVLGNRERWRRLPRHRPTR